MKVLIFGGNGMLGHKLVQTLDDKFEVFAAIRGDFLTVKRFDIFEPRRLIGGVDVTNISTVENALASVMPDVVINAVGIIKHLPLAKDVIQTLTVNTLFPHHLSELSDQHGFRLITISTDCVFAGSKGNYSEDDSPDAHDLYGLSKQLGEISTGRSLTLRTSIIGRELSSAHSLVAWFISNRGGRVRGFVNAIYSGFPTVVFADIISSLIEEFPDLTGLYHVSSDPINKFALLGLVNARFGLGIEIDRFEDFHIDRSLDSSAFRKAIGFKPDTWPVMIDRMFMDSTPYEKWKG